MDPQVSTSFIPKKNLDNGVSRAHNAAGATGLVLLISILIFVASLVAAGGVFLYKGILAQSISGMSEMLKKNEDAYDFPLIQEFMRTDARIREAQTLLSKHIAPSAIFSFLSMQTLKKVQFVSFDYSLKADGTINLELKGIADSFSTIALQSDQFGANKLLKDVVFSGVSADPQSSKVAFSVSANMVPSVILYSSVLAASAGGAPAETAPAESATPQ